MACIGLIVFFIRLCPITLVLEYLPGHLESLKELYEFIETPGVQVESLLEYMFLPLSRQCKLNDIYCFVVS